MSAVLCALILGIPAKSPPLLPIIGRIDGPPPAAAIPIGGPYYRLSPEHAPAASIERFWPDRLRRVELDREPFEDLQWHLDNDGSLTPTWPQIVAGADINIAPAWQITTGDPRVVIAVLDTGVPADHVDLPAANRNAARDFIDGDDDPSPPGSDSLDAHGVAVAALALARRNDLGVVGVCPDCTLSPLRVIATSSLVRDGDLVGALSWAARFADVILASWSYDPFAYVSPAVHDALRWAAQNGRDGAGCIVVFSAGNRAQVIDPFAPQAMGETLTVGATDHRDLRAGYSNTGPSLSLVAPGGVADDFVGGERVPQPKLLTADLAGDAGNNPHKDDADAPGIVGDLAVTATFKGTSAAAPQVAGAAALLISVAPTLTAREVTWILTETAAPVGPIPYDNGGRNDSYGHGRLDVGAAVAMAVAGTHCRETTEDCQNGVDDDCDRAIDQLDPDCGGPDVRAFTVPIGKSCTGDPGECGDGYCLAADGSAGARTCTALCDFDCPGDSPCVGAAGRGRCMPRCDAALIPAALCASGLTCAVPDPRLLPPDQLPPGVCLPACGADGDCRDATCLAGACAGPLVPAPLDGGPANPGCACVSGASPAGGGVLWVLGMLWIVGGLGARSRRGSRRRRGDRLNAPTR